MKYRLLLAFAVATMGCSFNANGMTGDSPTDAGGLSADASVNDEADGAIDGGAVDAGRTQDVDAAGSLCGASCTLAGGSCDGDVCVIDCSGLNLCGPDVTCPDGVPCQVTCKGKDACAGGVTCNGPRCAVLCDGEGACSEGVDCLGPACDIECRGKGACEDGPCCTFGGDSGNCTECSAAQGGCCECGGC